MKRKRKMLSLTSAILCLALIGCSNTPQPPKETGSAPAESVPTDQPGQNSGETEENGGAGQKESETEKKEVYKATAPSSLESIKAELTFEEIKAPKLSEIGKFTLPDGGDGYTASIFAYDDVLTLNDHTDHLIGSLNYKGDMILEKDGGNMAKLRYSPYFVTTVINESGLPSVTLMDKDANILISAEEKAGIIEEFLDNDRFLIVYFIEEETDDEEKAVYQSVDHNYTGSVKVYDLKEKKFLENTKMTTRPAFHAHGDSVYDGVTVSETHRLKFVSADDRVHTIEGDDGHYDMIGAKLIAHHDYINHIIDAYDHDMNPLFTVPYDMEELPGTEDFYVIKDKDTDLKGVIHVSGTILFEPKYKYINYIGGQFFSFSMDGSSWGMVDMEGNEILPATYYRVFYTGIPGVFAAIDKDNVGSLFDQNGEFFLKDQKFRVDSSLNHSILPYNRYMAVLDQETYANDFYVINDKDFTLHGKTFDYFGEFILYSLPDKALYSLVTGEKLTEGFDRAYSAYGYVYLVKDDVVTIYEVN